MEGNAALEVAQIPLVSFPTIRMAHIRMFLNYVAKPSIAERGCQKLTVLDAIHGYAPRGYLLFSNLDKDKRSCRAFSLEIALCRLWQGQCSHENCADSRAYQDNAQRPIGGLNTNIRTQHRPK